MFVLRDNGSAVECLNEISKWRARDQRVNRQIGWLKRRQVIGLDEKVTRACREGSTSNDDDGEG